MRVLVIEDDRATADYIRQGLLEAGHDVDLARDGRQGMTHALSSSYDVIVTDRNLVPGPDGLTIVRALRAAGTLTPVLMLTALHEVTSRVEGLDAGADDYLAKPFAFSELRARLDALARRPAPVAEPKLLRFHDLEMDPENGTVRRGGKPIALLPAEQKLLRYMLRRPGQLLTRTMLLEQVFNLTIDPNTNIVDVHMSRLRRKLEAGHESEPLISTVRGSGYRLGTG